MTILDRMLENAAVYRVWQAPFAERKFRPIQIHNSLTSVGHVLDVGCGPGTNSHHFPDAGYLGIDFNERYVEEARQRHSKQYVAADATNHTFGDRRFDFILVNSLLHHLADDDVHRVLGRLRDLLTPMGHVHILDLELTPGPSISRVLARLDRGDHARSFSAWRRLFEEYFEPVVLERFGLGLPGLRLWNMVYFKGKANSP